jgi:hypothetical protein
MTSDDIMTYIENAAKTYNLIGSFSTDFSGAGDSFSDFDSTSVTCIHCGVTRTSYDLIYRSSPVRMIPAHDTKCPCSISSALAAEFEQQALDVICFTPVDTRTTAPLSNVNLWAAKEDLLFQIIDLDARSDFNNDGCRGAISIYFNTLTVDIEVSEYEQVCNDLGTNTYDKSYFTGVKEPEVSKDPKVDVDALGDFKTWLTPS